MPFCNVHFRYPSIIGISHCTLLTHELSTLVKFYITKPLTLFPRRYPLSSTTHDLLRWNQQLLQDQCKWPPINSLCETRRRVAAICPFNGNCDIPSTCFRVSVCVLVHASITHALRASHARSYRPSRVSNVRLQFHLLLRHAFPWLFAFPAYYSFRFIFLCASSVRCRRYFTTDRINIVYLYVHSSFLPLSILSSRFINSRMIWIIQTSHVLGLYRHISQRSITYVCNDRQIGLVILHIMLPSFADLYANHRIHWPCRSANDSGKLITIPLRSSLPKYSTKSKSQGYPNYTTSP